tara:strand:+ start:127 stop:456 length:330 start_codon:yes stop_codon:yes gene_type:complete
MSTTEIDYGNLTKRIIFTDNDHRQAQLLIRLKQDALTQSAFFRHIITGYITGDERIQGYIDEVKQQSKSRKAKSKKLRHKGKETLKDLVLSEGEIENIFDLLEEEHPEL